MSAAVRRLAAAAAPVVVLLAAAIGGPAGRQAAASGPPDLGGARLEPRSFADLGGWAGDDHAAALAAFRATCRAIAEGREALRTAVPADADLKRVCAAALEGGVDAQARSFFETNFEPFEVVPPAGRGFLTGYFEPEYPGSLVAADGFATPLLARPDDLVAIPPGEALPGLEGLAAARRTPSGHEPYPDRAAIEDGALGSLARPLLYLRDPVDLTVIQVQGSARIRLPDGRVVRVAYAGKNGHPFTAVGRILVERGHVPLTEMSLARLTGWLKANPEEGREIMRLNRSYVFFRIADELGPDDGPVGGAGVPLAAGRSLAVDRGLWSYGLPFWLEAELPLPGGGTEPLRRLLVAQDTGSAILGPARGDVFFGTGADAGARAGLVRHPARFVVLRPRAPGP